MSVGVEVDALALMLDGHVEDGWRASTGWVRELERRSVESDLFVLANETQQWVEVAEAILQLEALADWRPIEGGLSTAGWSLLADDAAKHAGFFDVGDADADTMLLEAAARLRDGWRPKGWNKR